MSNPSLSSPPPCHVVITGGAGFLGVRLARSLLALGQLSLAGAAPALIARITLVDRAPPPDDAVEVISSALHNAVQVTNDPDHANALLLTTPSLAKGILSSICDGQDWHTDLTRIRRGEILLGDVPSGRWRLL